jgi:hypothetical protein
VGGIFVLLSSWWTTALATLLAFIQYVKSATLWLSSLLVREIGILSRYINRATHTGRSALKERLQSAAMFLVVSLSTLIKESCPMATVPVPDPGSVCDSVRASPFGVSRRLFTIMATLLALLTLTLMRLSGTDIRTPADYAHIHTHSHDALFRVPEAVRVVDLSNQTMDSALDHIGLPRDSACLVEVNLKAEPISYFCLSSANANATADVDSELTEVHNTGTDSTTLKRSVSLHLFQ